jgi:hypothetical protein
MFLLLWLILLVFTKTCQAACTTQIASHLAEFNEREPANPKRDLYQQKEDLRQTFHANLLT